jgi:ATP-dependent DNA helicase PIF1
MTQERALSILKTGANVCLTGEPGSGKTHTVNRYISYLREHSIDPSITASTGIAATHVGGMTIHSWSGIGIKRTLSPYELDALLSKESLSKRLKAAKVLIIDEISMLDAAVLDTVEQVTRLVRVSAQPFGGLQVIFVGDFFQLPPIAERGGGPARFAFESRAWKTANPIVCYLSEQHRQEDEAYLKTLIAIRTGDIGDHIYEHLKTRHESAPTGEVTRLYTHNADVDRMNDDALSRIEGEPRTYVMDGQGNSKLVEGLRKSCISPETLVLKPGATVMFTKNNFEAGYVNGTLGTVALFDRDSGRPIVETREGKRITVELAEWAVEDGGRVLARITQLPLRLAWAITVHKSQGMSLDAALMDLSRAFEYGQGYVALSRVRTMDGLYLQGLNTRALEVHPTVLEYDANFKENSKSADAEFDKMSGTELKSLQDAAIVGMGGVLEAKKRAAVMEQGGKLAELRKKYPNAGRPWSQEDSDAMVARFEAGEKEKEIAKHFGRKPSAIHARLVQLGIIEDDSDYFARKRKAAEI